jgi:hypothetical protein
LVPAAARAAFKVRLRRLLLLLLLLLHVAA